MNSKPIQLENCIFIEANSDGGEYEQKKCIYPLKGNKEYYITRCTESRQNLELDRTVSVSTNFVIDQLSVQIKLCDKLQVVFSGIGGNNFEKEENLFNLIQYRNNEISLPGQKYIMFFFEKRL